MSNNTLALLGGSPAIDSTNEESYPRFSETAARRVVDLLERGTTVGLNKQCPEIDEAETAIAEWHGVANCLGTSSGHGALHSALIGLEVTSGDEVITTPYTWGASTSCILHNNAIPVFADVDPATGLLDPDTIEEKITGRTKAILVVHLFGQPADMTRICAIAKKHSLVVIEDGSQAHGALHRNKMVGAFGDAAGFSCMGGKLLATAEAGYMVTPDKAVYFKAAMGGQHMGRSPESGFPEEFKPYADSLVYTYRLNPITAVLLIEQLKKLPAEIESRRQAAAKFRGLLTDCGCVAFPDYAEGDSPAYHMITMNFQTDHAQIEKATYIQALKAEGVGIFAYIQSPIPSWPRLQWQTYKGPRVMWLDNLEKFSVDYSTVDLPGCKERIANSLEMLWNFLEGAGPVERVADAFVKVEEQLDALRDWERTQP